MIDLNQHKSKTCFCFSIGHEADSFIPYLHVYLLVSDGRSFIVERGVAHPCRYADDYRVFRLAAEDEPETPNSLNSLFNFYQWASLWQTRAACAGLKFDLNQDFLQIIIRCEKKLKQRGLLPEHVGFFKEEICTKSPSVSGTTA